MKLIDLVSDNIMKIVLVKLVHANKLANNVLPKKLNEICLQYCFQSMMERLANEYCKPN